MNKTQHDAQGNPVINTARFPDMAGLVKYGHDSGLQVGWYENGCACGERHAVLENYEGDVRMLHSLGFDSVKLDGCGAQRNSTSLFRRIGSLGSVSLTFGLSVFVPAVTLYAQLMKATGKAYLIENCTWSGSFANLLIRYFADVSRPLGQVQRRR